MKRYLEMDVSFQKVILNYILLFINIIMLFFENVTLDKNFHIHSISEKTLQFCCYSLFLLIKHSTILSSRLFQYTVKRFKIYTDFLFECILKKSLNGSLYLGNRASPLLFAWRER